MDYKIQLSYIESSTVIKNINNSSFNYLVFNIIQETKFNFFIYVCENNAELELTKKEIEFYSNKINILTFPEWNIIPYDVNSPKNNIQIERMKTIFELLKFKKSNKKTLLLISKNSLVQKIINKKDYKFIDLKVEQNITINEVEKLLEENCYKKTETVYKVGDFSINNNNIDLITFNDLAYRIIIEKDKIKEIKNLDINSQIASGKNEKIFTLPLSEVIFSLNNIQNFKQKYRVLFDLSPEKDFLYNSVSNNKMYNGFENWLPLFYKNELETIFDYLEKDVVFIYDISLIEKINDFILNIKKYYNLRLENINIKTNEIYNPIPVELLYLEDFESKIKQYINIVFDTENKIKNKRQMELNFKNVPEFYKDSRPIFDSLKEFLLKE